MNKDIYNWIALALVLVVFALALFIYRPVERNLTRVTVLGESTAKVAPDTAVITFAVVTQSRQAVEAQQRNAQTSEAVRIAIEKASVDSKAEIRTSNYSLDPEQDYYSGKMPKILGYEVKNTVSVSVDSLDRVGAIIDAATAAGANSVEGIQFVVGQASPAQGGSTFTRRHPSDGQGKFYRNIAKWKDRPGGAVHRSRHRSGPRAGELSKHAEFECFGKCCCSTGNSRDGGIC